MSDELIYNATITIPQMLKSTYNILSMINIDDTEMDLIQDNIETILNIFKKYTENVTFVPTTTVDPVRTEKRREKRQKEEQEKRQKEEQEKRQKEEQEKQDNKDKENKK